MSRSLRCRALALIVFPLLVFCLVPCSFARDTATIVRIVDGDTLEITLNGQPEKVRLIGVDTPEKYDSDKLRRDVQRTGQDGQTLKALGERASAFTERVVHPGMQVSASKCWGSRSQSSVLQLQIWIPATEDGS